MDTWNKAKQKLNTLSTDYMKIVTNQLKSNPSSVIRIDKEKGTYLRYEFKVDEYDANLEVSMYSDETSDKARYILYNDRESRSYIKNITGYATKTYGFNF